MRGVPDVGFQASATTGALVFISLPPDGQSGLRCGNVPCSTGWFDIGGTSLSCPQWAGLVAIADQINGGHDLGLINPALYKIGSNPARYANDFFDITTGQNQTDRPSPATRLRQAGIRSRGWARPTRPCCFPTSSTPRTVTRRRASHRAVPSEARARRGSTRTQSGPMSQARSAWLAV